MEIEQLNRPRPPAAAELCSCGQELDICVREHCPRCGAAIAH